MTMAGTYTSGGGLDDAESIRTIHRALELGVTHIDTAALEETIRVAPGDLVLTRDRRGAALPPHLVPQSRFHTTEESRTDHEFLERRRPPSNR